ncbi:MAG: 16S rRNA (guanine(527)-N(7))-methyltransferase RsmG [Myxococcales bacterium]|nr:16S rRNA (guanine(527)-N(7))-methyltransferase RsmG [Myxococcales bacterium]
MSAVESAATVLVDGARELAIPLDGALVDALLRFLGLLEQWNRTFNLVGPASIEEWAVRHLLDSLAILRRIDLVGRLLDVGSGAGLPGVPLALARPSLDVSLNEPNRKRQSFLRRSIAELGLTNARVEGERLATLSGRYDFLVARAVWSPDALAVAAGPHLVEGGGLIVLTSAPPTPELAGGFLREICDSFVLPTLGAPRSVSLYRRAS